MDKSLIQTMLALGSLLIISVLASKSSTKFGIPILLIFIGIGILSGSEGIAGIAFNDVDSTRILGTVSLIFILFSGGLSTQLKNVKPVWREGLSLALIGVLLSTFIMAGLIHWVTDWNWTLSCLLSATISSTDAAAVFGILKTRKLYLRENIQSVIELESGSNDPMAVFLTLTLIQILLRPEAFSWGEILMNFFIQMSLGGLAGWLFGQGMVKLINWLDLEQEGLYPVLTMAGVICIYSLTEYCGGNGFLAVYLAGLFMSDEKYFNKKGLEVFHDGAAWLMQVAMFLTLGLLVNPSELVSIAVPGVILALSLLFVARPLSVFLCLVWFRYSLKEMWFISWGGLRGAVPIIIATYFLLSGIPLSKTMFNLVFFIVMTSMLIQGTTLPFWSRYLKMQHLRPPQRKLPFKSRSWSREFIEYEVSRTSPLIGKTILELDLPDDVLVVLIHRVDKDFIPRGNTELEPYDRIICLAHKDMISSLDERLRPAQTFH